MALTLAAEIAGRATAESIQLLIEYDPQPPFDAGAPHKAPKAMVRKLKWEMVRANGLKFPATLMLKHWKERLRSSGPGVGSEASDRVQTRA
jgi:hypothetical protein